MGGALVESGTVPVGAISRRGRVCRRRVERGRLGDRHRPVPAGLPVLAGWSRIASLAVGVSADAALLLSVSVTTAVLGALTFYLSRREQRLLIEKEMISRQRADAEARYRVLFEAAPDAMIIVGADGRIAFANDQTDRIFGYPREELVGQEVEVLVPQRMRGKHSRLRADFFADPMQRQMGVGLELWGLRRDGTEFAIDISLSPLRIEQDSYVAAAIRDVTERRERDQLIETQRQLERQRAEAEAGRALLRANSDAMLEPQAQIGALRDTDAGIVDFTFLDVNRAACDYFMLDREDLVGTTLLRSFPNVAGSGLLAHFAVCADTGEPVALDDFPYFNEILDSPRRYDIRTARISADLVSLTWRDVTERFNAATHRGVGETIPRADAQLDNRHEPGHPRGTLRRREPCAM